MIVLKLLGALVLALLACLAVAVLRTLAIKETAAKTAKPPKADPARAKAYGEKLAEMVRIETVSSRFDPDRKKFAAIPLALSSAVCILVPSLISQTSVLLIVIGALTIGVSFIFYKKGALDE